MFLWQISVFAWAFAKLGSMLKDGDFLRCSSMFSSGWFSPWKTHVFHGRWLRFFQQAVDGRHRSTWGKKITPLARIKSKDWVILTVTMSYCYVILTDIDSYKQKKTCLSHTFSFQWSKGPHYFLNLLTLNILEMLPASNGGTRALIVNDLVHRRQSNLGENAGVWCTADFQH